MKCKLAGQFHPLLGSLEKRNRACTSLLDHRGLPLGSYNFSLCIPWLIANAKQPLPDAYALSWHFIASPRSAPITDERGGLDEDIGSQEYQADHHNGEQNHAEGQGAPA